MPHTALKSILHPDIIQNTDQVNGRVQLKEAASEAKLKSVWLYGLDADGTLRVLCSKRRRGSSRVFRG
ncbi:MAG: hypothetical protein DRI57_03660 [Deltaproteobacteria bacterium]|nr:MAG: hypothetical protein DRI57_03660 [Deltaproteobacteria bacterium]